jgi:hypothetical protein
MEAETKEGRSEESARKGTMLASGWKWECPVCLPWLNAEAGRRVKAVGATIVSCTKDVNNSCGTQQNGPERVKGGGLKAHFKL